MGKTSAVEDGEANLLAQIESKRSLPELAISFNAFGDVLEGWCASEPPRISMAGIDGAPDWYAHETYVWRLGERIRAAVKDSYGAKGLKPIAEELELFVSRRPLGKGRQCWVAFATDQGGETSAARLGQFLVDEEVNGIVLKGLCRYRVPGFRQEALRIASGSSSRVARTQAKRYLKLDLE